MAKTKVLVSISQETLGLIDWTADELGLNRSATIELLCSAGLHFKPPESLGSGVADAWEYLAHQTFWDKLQAYLYQKHEDELRVRMARISQGQKGQRKGRGKK